MFGSQPKQPQHLTIEIPQANKKATGKAEVRARRFVLEDDEGGIRAQLQSAGNGAVALTFHDQGGKLGVLVGLDPKQNPTLALVKEGKMKAGLELDKESGQPALNLKGAADSQVTVGFDSKNNAEVSLTDQAGRLRVSITLAPNGEAQVALYDTKGYVREKMTQK